MSLILEALKKAERQHKLGEVPGIGGAPQDVEQNRSKLFSIVLLGVVAIGMLSLGIYLGEEESPQPLSRYAEPALELPAPVSMQPPVQRKPAGRSMVDSGSATPVEKIIQLPLKKPEPEPVETDIQAPVKKISKPAVSSKADASSQVVKTINELPDGYIENLPKLNIDIHSYDKQPGRSYVLINMEKYREGDRLTEGPLVSDILPDGVVLEHRGERFILPIGNY